MSGYSKRASNASHKSGKAELVLDLPTVNKMLPLVQRIVADLIAAEGELGPLLWERERLERNRRTLDWPARQRRYQVDEDVRIVEKRRKDLATELEGLGVAVIDAIHGRTGFPTIVNGKAAFFSWQPGEDLVGFWHFQGDERRRPIPPSWLQGPPVSAPTKKRRG